MERQAGKEIGGWAISSDVMIAYSEYLKQFK